MAYIKPITDILMIDPLPRVDYTEDAILTEYGVRFMTWSPGDNHQSPLTMSTFRETADR